MPAQPKRPTFGWDNFRQPPGAAVPLLAGIDALPQRLLTTSGRAALWAATQALGLTPGSRVLVPSYHCPTLVAPLRHAGCEVMFYPLDANGLPRLGALATDARAIVVPQLFGLPQSLAAVRAWCDAHGVALIEDCAHSFFGAAGERPVGHWGDVATASLSKFFPVTEGGLLASAQRPWTVVPALAPAGAKQQLKAALDVIERATEQRRLTGLNTLLGGVLRLKNGPPRIPPLSAPDEHAPPTEPELMRECDLARVGHELPGFSRWLFGALPRARIAARRRAHYRWLHETASALGGTRPLFPFDPAAAAPYAMPLLVDDAREADRAYQQLRQAGVAVFRWDRVWPGVPTFPDDHGARWQRQVLQLLCHQDLDDAMLAHTCRELQHALPTLTR